jgi:rhamnosyl/mannosyltransferase
MSYLWENPVKAAEMGQRAEQRYWQLFTADQMVTTYLELYNDLIDGK